MSAPAIAVIPARKGTKRFPHKNRKFFAHTADFIDREGWFDRVVVSTDDEVVADLAKERGYEVHARPAELAGDAVSIKAVFVRVASDLRLPPEAVLWLFYLPLVFKRSDDFRKARELMASSATESLCGFVPAKTHPYNCWRWDERSARLSQFVPNDAFRSQDLPPAWMHHHYVCASRVRELPELNSELLNERTRPYFIDRGAFDSLIEIDTPEDYERWLAVSAGEER